MAINGVLTTWAEVVKLADLRHWRVMTGGKKIISGHRNRSFSSPCLKSPINRDDGCSRAQARLDKGWAILIRSGTSCFGTSTITYLADLLGRNESAWLKHKVNTICLGNCRVINRLGSEARNFPYIGNHSFRLRNPPQPQVAFCCSKTSPNRFKTRREHKIQQKISLFYLFATL